MANENCIGGTVASLQVVNTDCSCISISSITWNSQGTQFTITLNNGQSITSPVLEGAEGATPVIAFRVSGNMLQYNVDGGAWNNLYNLALLIGSKILTNQFPALSTLGTSYESLAVGRTPFVMAADTMSTNDDEIKIHAAFTTNNKASSASKLVRIYFNSATQLNLDPVSLGSSIYKVEYDARLVRISNTTAKYELITTRYTYGGANVATFYSSSSQNVTTLAGLDFTGAAINIDVQGNSSTIGDITCTAFEVTYGHKI